MQKKKFFYFFLILIFISLCSNSFAKIYKFNETPQVIIEGSTTLYNFVISKYKDSIEKEAGVKLIIRQTNSGRGLLSLVKNTADIAMISTDFDILVQQVNKDNNYKFRPINFHKFVVGNVSADFIVNKNNPIDFMPVNELKEILTGKIYNWADVGQKINTVNIGTIQIVTEEEIGGLFTLIQKYLLKGEKISEDRITVHRASLIPKTVSKLDGGIGFITSTLPEDKRYGTKILDTPASDLRQELSLIVKKNNLDKRQIALIKAIRKYAGYKPIKNNKEDIYNPYQAG